MPPIVLSPFSNSTLRDWPHFGALIGLLVERTPFDITLVGTAGQRVAADGLVRHHPATRVSNVAGVISWVEVLNRVKSAALLVANNSGLAHLAAGFGVPTVCIFAASHSPYEWMARGPNSTAIVKETICSPCGIDVRRNCPYEVRCLSEIDAETVFRACMARLHAVANSPGADFSGADFPGAMQGSHAGIS